MGSQAPYTERVPGNKGINLKSVGSVRRIEKKSFLAVAG
jgi:hypothetical protein